MEAGAAAGEFAGPQMAGFKDFYQFLAPTRVVAGRGLLDGIGLEFAKEGAKRVLIVTDEVIRDTGLVDRVASGLEDGGVEPAGVYDRVPQDSDSAVVVEAAEAGHDRGANAILAVGGGSVMDTPTAASRVSGRATSDCPVRTTGWADPSTWRRWRAYRPRRGPGRRSRSPR